jgi:hypothetical protein
LHRFHRETEDLAADKRLATFVLTEICECDVTVGGVPTVYVIPKGDKVQRVPETEVSQLMEWAADLGTRLARDIVAGPTAERE